MDALHLYASIIHKFDVLPNDEVIELIEKAQKGDIEARNKVVNHNLKLVMKISKEFYYNKIDKMDLISEGNIGIMEAIDNFNIYKNVNFSTYVYYRIRRRMSRYIEDHKSTIRIPTYLHGILRKIVTKLNDNKDLTEEEEKTYNRCSLDICSLNVKLNSPKALISEESYELQDALIGDLPDWTNQDLQTLISILNPREKDIITRRLNGEKLREIGKSYKLSRERIRQIQQEAINKMKNKIKKF